MFVLTSTMTRLNLSKGLRSEGNPFLTFYLTCRKDTAYFATKITVLPGGGFSLSFFCGPTDNVVKKFLPGN